MKKQIKSALISVYYKDGLEDIIRQLDVLGVTIYTTGGTQTFIESFGVTVQRVEDLTGYPSILGGRVKTLHPKVFGGILAMREDDHISQLKTYDIPEIDLVIVDLYPFEETVQSTSDEASIIEKIDIGGISLIRAAAKNFKEVVVIPSKDQYLYLLNILKDQNGFSELNQRRYLSAEAFKISSHYDTAIYDYLADDSQKAASFKHSILQQESIRYGENPHQKAMFFGDFGKMFDKLSGKELSYNNLVDIDAAVALMSEFKNDKPTFAILKHTNACGVATRNTILDAWNAALEADPVSAFGGILISNHIIDLAAATAIDKIFYEVLIAPDFTEDAKMLLTAKSKRILLQQKSYELQPTTFKTLLNGVILQDGDLSTEDMSSMEVKTRTTPSPSEFQDLVFALKCAKHLKSNTIVLAKNSQLLGMGCGQTSRVDSCKQAIVKAYQYGLDLDGAVMASDAFFPFPDCVELVCKEGIKAVVQPGGSIKDQLSIDYCNDNSMSMVFTGIRHFRH
ncbi:MAG: bifunctional phosphoribosylaminoimidazolecarboxamide formyltransferase/IMP cyclohydrolase [Saprospiraceae bacterium]